MSSGDKSFQPTDPVDRGELAPGAELIDSPLLPGGRSGAEPGPLSSTFPGLVDDPGTPRDPRVGLNPVRRAGWLSSRASARERFRDISSKTGATSQGRVLAGLRGRGGLLARARKSGARERLHLRGHIIDRRRRG